MSMSGSFTAGHKLLNVAQSPTVEARNNFNIRVSSHNHKVERELSKIATLPDNACPEKLIDIKKSS
jgi:hypothetical protein